MSGLPIRATRAVVTYESDRVTPEEIVAAIERLGYSAERIDEEDAG